MRQVRSVLLSWAGNAIVLLVVTLALDEVTNDTTGSLLVAAAIFGLLNCFVKPVLKLMALPVAFITHGLIYFPIAMLMLWLTSLLVSGFEIDGLGTVAAATIVVWLVNMGLDLTDWIFDRRPGAPAQA